MKIAFVTLSNLPNPPVLGGAIETLIDDLCLQNEIYKNHEIDVYSIYHAEAEKASETYSYSHYYYYTKKNKKFCIKNIVYKLTGNSILDKSANQVIRRINKNKYDFVVMTPIIRELKNAFRKIKAKTVWYLHGDPLSVLKTKDLERIAGACDMIITVSDFISSRIGTIKQAKNIHTVLNCVNLEPISKENEDSIRESVRNEYGIDKESTLITYVGRITPIKGVLELIKAFVKNNDENTKLLIVGAPSNDFERDYYSKLKETSNQSVIFAGYVDHSKLSRVYCASDIVAVPSICLEAAQLTVTEALICNRKVIATNIGGVPEYSFGDNVILVDYNSEFENSLGCALKRAKEMKTSQDSISDKYKAEKFYLSFFETLENY